MATTSNTITATAGQTEFSFSFPYLKKESIKVTIDTVATTAFTIPDNNPTTVVLDSGATAGQVIKISRLTSTTATPATFFSGGAIRSQDLNNNFDSILYITQERENQTEEIIQGGIADGSITSSKLADQSVGTAALIDGGVATVDLADNAVTTAKLADANVTTAKILDNAVTTDKIINDAVTTDKLVDNAVTPAKLDRTYVETAGDEMTGDLTVPSLNGGQLAGLRNVLINGTVTINQRGKTYAGVGNGAYWADRWKRTAGGMTQIIEEGNYKPGIQYTLSGTGVTTAQITSPVTGNWTIPDVPSTATMIQLEEGSVATPFELRPIGLELSLCQRYYQASNINEYYQLPAASATQIQRQKVTFPVYMRTTANVVRTKVDGVATISADGSTTQGFRSGFYGAVRNTINYSWTASAEL